MLPLFALATLAAVNPTPAPAPAGLDTLLDGADLVRCVPTDNNIGAVPLTIPRTLLPPDLSAVSVRGVFTPAHMGLSRRQLRATLTHEDKLFIQTMTRAKFARKGPKNTPRRQRATLSALNN